MTSSTKATESPEPIKTEQTGESTQGKPKTLIAAASGNVLEWFDWTMFAVFTPFIAPKFFDTSNPTSAVLSTLVVFAVGFLMRPLGGLVFGRIADRRGRKTTMVLCMCIVAAGSLLIAVAPTYEQIGVYASVWLVIARLLQGFAHGGEVGGAMTFVIETAPNNRRGLWASSMAVALTVGTLAATILGAILTSTLSEDNMSNWGWRVPFAIGAVLSIYALYLRRGLVETTQFTESIAIVQKSSIMQDLRQNWRPITRAIGITAGITSFHYIWSVAASSFAITTLGVDPTNALWATSIGNVVFCVALLGAGALSDKYGRRRNGMIFGLVGAVTVVPLFGMLSESALTLGVVVSLALIICAFGTSVNSLWPIEMMPVNSRAMSFGFAYSVAVALFGGTAPLLQTWMKEQGLSDLFGWYIAGMCLVTLITSFVARDTRGKDLSQ